MHLKSFQALKSYILIEIEWEIFGTLAISGLKIIKVIGGEDEVESSLVMEEEFWESIKVNRKLYKEGRGRISF